MYNELSNKYFTKLRKIFTFWMESNLGYNDKIIKLKNKIY